MQAKLTTEFSMCKKHLNIFWFQFHMKIEQGTEDLRGLSKYFVEIEGKPWRMEV